MSKPGPRFNIASTKAGTGASVIDELIGRTPPQAPSVTSDGEIVGTITRPRGSDEDGVNKFVDAVQALPIDAAVQRGETPTLQDCERQIAVVSHQWVIGTGEALKRIHDGELWRESTDVVYDSWTSYLRHRWDWTPQRAHQLMKAVRSAKAVAPVADSEIKEGHTRVLDRIFDELKDEEKAEQACRDVWQAAAQTRRPSAAALERAAVEKGYLPRPDSADDSPPPPKTPVSPMLVRYQRALTPFEDLRGLEALVEEAPDTASEIAAKLRAALQRLETKLHGGQRPPVD